MSCGIWGVLAVIILGCSDIFMMVFSDWVLATWLVINTRDSYLYWLPLACIVLF